MLASDPVAQTQFVIVFVRIVCEQLLEASKFNITSRCVDLEAVLHFLGVGPLEFGYNVAGLFVSPHSVETAVTEAVLDRLERAQTHGGVVGGAPVASHVPLDVHLAQVQRRCGRPQVPDHVG